MKRFQRILAAIDPDRASAAVLERIFALASNHQAALTFATVAPRMAADLSEGGAIRADLQAAAGRAHREKLDALLEPHTGRWEFDTRLLVGTPFLETIRAVLRDGYDLVVRMPGDPVWVDRLLGSDDMHLLRKCPCPVWLMRPSAPKTYRRVLAAVDVGDNHPPEETATRQALNRSIVGLAASVALADFAELHIVHAWGALGEQALRYRAFMATPEHEIQDYVEKTRRHHAARLEALVQEVMSELGKEAFDYLRPHPRLIKGVPREAIPAAAVELGADLIVMGTVARTGVPGLIIGNTAETILGRIDSSVLAVKPPGFVTPVEADGR
jgi:nucleotide-binding universal stress UspA family protein